MSNEHPDPSVSGAPVRGEPIAVELMNTLWADREGLHDALATARGANAWLGEVGDRLPHIRAIRGSVRTNLTAAEAAQLRRLRDAIRIVAANVTADPRVVADPPGPGRMSVDDAVSAINDAAASLSPRLLRRVKGVVIADRRANSSVDASIAGFAVDAVPLLAGEHEGGPLRACLAPRCVLYFAQDHSRREWCSPACGNRARVARHYARAQVAKRRSSTR